MTTEWCRGRLMSDGIEVWELPEGTHTINGNQGDWTVDVETVAYETRIVSVLDDEDPMVKTVLEGDLAASLAIMAHERGALSVFVSSPCHRRPTEDPLQRPDADSYRHQSYCYAAFVTDEDAHRTLKSIQETAGSGVA